MMFFFSLILRSEVFCGIAAVLGGEGGGINYYLEGVFIFPPVIIGSNFPLNFGFLGAGSCKQLDLALWG